MAGATPWNSAAHRGAFDVVKQLYAWVGLAGPMAFDVFTGKRYLGKGDQAPHISRPGGGSQILVHRSLLSHLKLIGTVPLARTTHVH